MKNYIQEIEECLKTKDIMKIKELLHEGANQGSIECRFMIGYAEYEPTWAEKQKYLERNFDKLKIKITYKEFCKYLSLTSPYYKECAKDLQIDLKYVLNEVLVNWLLVKKLEVEKTKLESFWQDMKDESFIRIISVIINMFKNK